LDELGGAVPLTSLPFPSAYTARNAAFNLSITGLGVGSRLHVGAGAHNTQRQINVVDGFTWQAGAHSVKFGVDFRRLSPVVDPQNYTQSVSFRNVLASETGNSSFGGSFAYNNFGLLFHNLGLYAQDTWNVSGRLTLTYGLRWDVDFAPSSESGPPLPSVTGYSLVDFSQLGFATLGTPPFHTTYGNLAPRLGAAYRLSQRPGWERVLRGGVGLFYDLVSAETGNLLSAAGPPFENYVTFTKQVFPFTPAQIAPVSIPETGTLSYVYAINPNLKLPYTLEWNVALEQSLGTPQSISVSYIGAKGSRLLQTTELFTPPSNPNIGQGLFVDNSATSYYNALQLQFQRRLSRGLQAIASYTWSHSIDDASGSSYGNTSNLGVPGSSRGNRGDSDFDVRNAFSAGITYEIPAPGEGLLTHAILGGWSLESFILAHSSLPLDVSDANFSNFDTGILANIRPDTVPTQPLYLHGNQYPGGKAVNAAAFSDPPVNPATGNPTRQGNLQRNVLRGFGATQWDLAVHRDFKIREWIKLQFRAEMFNVLNHPNFGPPYNQFGGNGFGLATQTLGQSLAGSGGLSGGAFNPLYQIGGPRSIQLALKLVL